LSVDSPRIQPSRVPSWYPFSGEVEKVKKKCYGYLVRVVVVILNVCMEVGVSTGKWMLGGRRAGNKGVTNDIRVTIAVRVASDVA
jgi:hypothetical protein